MVFRRNAALLVAMALATTSSSAIELIGAEVPAACQQICLPVVLLSGACATAKRNVLGSPPAPEPGTSSSSISQPPAAARPSSSDSPPSRTPATSSPPTVTTPPPPPSPSSSPSSSPSTPATSPPTTPSSTTLSSSSTPAPPRVPPPPVQLTPSPELTTPPPTTTTAEPETTEPATTSRSRRNRKGGRNRDSSSSREPRFGPAAESFLAGLSLANGGRPRRERDLGAVTIAPLLPTGLPSMDAIQKRDVVVGEGSNGSAPGQSRALKARASPEHDQFERACYCRNRSFDVLKISGLCGSCITQNVKTDQDRKGLAEANSILTKCEFPTASYQPDAARQAAGITLIAVMPLRLPANDPSGLIFAPGVAPKGAEPPTTGASNSGPVPATGPGPADKQGPIQRGGAAGRPSPWSLLGPTAVCWILLAPGAV